MIGLVIAIGVSVAVGVVVALVVYAVQRRRWARYAASHVWAPRHVQARRGDQVAPLDLNNLRRQQVAEATKGHRDQATRDHYAADGGEGRGVRSA